jgi:hypothetical protein
MIRIIAAPGQQRAQTHLAASLLSSAASDDECKRTLDAA